jgi:sugar lactone lactonase YvrE
MRFVLGLVLVVIALAVALPVIFPAPVDPIAWTPDPDPGLTGPFAPNDKLARVERLLDGVGVGPEDIACGPDGSRYTGLSDGRILQFTDDGNYRELANTGGRPLGMQLDNTGRLIVADAQRGLLAVSADGAIEVLTDAVNGEKILFADDLDIAQDGTIWFSDASTRYDYHQNIYNFIEGRPSGRLLSFSPASGETRVHWEGLFFANGVALGPWDSFVLVNETGAGRISRLWLRGPKSGERDVFYSGLPGMPDNLSSNRWDTFWVAMPSLRAGLDEMAGQPVLRKLLSRLPVEMLAAAARPYSFVVALGLDGQVKHNLQDTAAGFNNISSVNECDGNLYLGSLTMPAVGRYLL